MIKNKSGEKSENKTIYIYNYNLLVLNISYQYMKTLPLF